MADSYNPDSEPTTRTLLRRVLDTADPRTPRRRRSAWMSAQKATPETHSSNRQNSGTKTTVRRSQRIRSVSKSAHVQASRQLEEQTPRTLLTNILLTAPESSIVMPEPGVKPLPTPKVAQSSRRESSRGSLELQFQELEPSITVAPSRLALGKRKQRLRLSVFQQEVEQELPPSHEPCGNADASSLTSSLNLTFTTPLQPQSVQRPGLARRPPNRRAVDVNAFLQDIQDTSLALAAPGDNLRTPVATLPTDMVLEDTQPFSHPLVGPSPSAPPSLPCSSHTGAEDVVRLVRHGPQCSSSGVQNKMPFQDGVHEAEEKMEESWRVNKEKETTTQRPAGMEESEVHTEPEPEGSLGTMDISGKAASPELASSIPEFLQARQLHQLLEQAPPPSTAALSSEPLEPQLTRHPPKARTPSSRSRQDPYKIGLNHYMKFFTFYAKMPMEKKALEMVEKCLDKYFQHLCDDLEAYAAHAGRKTVGPEDLELLMRRQGLVTDQVSLHVLVERHLPLEYRQLLIPCAFSGNSVFPAQ
ncbi:centromere protein T isoform X2 [Erinaceus europaeus]|uniref:Centromere protein T n=1 Tax=Erinaceus europaeus TaxID=9365 RepID=A0ABM3WXN1_ERIEU|nr:centromere protein T isoform X2 [Erinaceus europaeus]